MKDDFFVPREVLKTSVDHYETVQAKHQGKKFFISWNWASFFFNFVWLIYRRCYLAAFLSYLGVYVLSTVLSGFVYMTDEIGATLSISLAIGLIINIIFGMIGDSIYLTAIKDKIRSYSFNPDARELIMNKCCPSWMPVIVYYLIVFGILFIFFAIIMGIFLLAMSVAG